MNTRRGFFRSIAAGLAAMVHGPKLVAGKAQVRSYPVTAINDWHVPSGPWRFPDHAVIPKKPAYFA